MSTHYITTDRLTAVHTTLIPGAELTPAPGIDSRDGSSDFSPSDPFTAKIYLTEDQATRWDAGLAACRAANLPASSIDGLQIRWEAMGFTGPIPATLVQWSEQQQVASDKRSADTVRADGRKQAADAAKALVGKGWVCDSTVASAAPTSGTYETLAEVPYGGGYYKQAITIYAVDADTRIEVLTSPVQGTVVYTHRRTAITRSQVRALQGEAEDAGDLSRVATCLRALGEGWPRSDSALNTALDECPLTMMEAWRECERIIGSPEPIEYLDLSDVADYLGLAYRSVTTYRSSDPTFPSPDVHLGQSPGWLPSTIDAWVARRPRRKPKKD